MIAVARRGFLLVEVVVALALSLFIVTFFTLTLGHTVYQLRYQRDRLTALCYARSALNKCYMNQTGVGVVKNTYGRFTTEVRCVSDSSYPRLLCYESTASWPDGSLTVRSGIVL